MPVHAGLASVSDVLFAAAIVIYGVAMIAYTAEYLTVRRRRAVRVVAAVGGPAPVTMPQAVQEPAAPSAAGERIGRLAMVITALGAVTQIASLVARGLAADRVPWGNMYEFISAICAVGVTAWLVLAARQPVRHLGAFVLLPVVTLLGIAGTSVYSPAGPLMPALNSYWLKIHVSFAATASGVFLVGFVAAVLYLIRDAHERRLAADRPMRFPATLGARLPTAAGLELITFRLHAVAFPIWTIAIILGAVWAEAAWSRYWGWDPKETWAFISWVVYAAYLHARATAGWRGRRAAWVAIIGWATMMIDLFAVNLVTADCTPTPGSEWRRRASTAGSRRWDTSASALVDLNVQPSLMPAALLFRLVFCWPGA
jgi:cytochrome c-type biogenesis protein CcsB